MKALTLCFALGAVAASQANVLFYNAANASDNVGKRAEWMSDAGISSAQHFLDFEAYAVGTNLDSVLLPGGALISHPTGNAIVQSSSSFFGGSNPIDTKALALAESNGSIVLTFATPVDYVGGFDIDQPGATIMATLADDSTISFSWDSTLASGNSAEFWGLWRNDAAQIAKIEFKATSGGDGEWGLDNLEYGAVPEPATLLAIGIGLLGTAMRKRKE